MVNKDVSDKYLNSESMRISYRFKDDSIHITSGDADLSGFHLTLNKNTPSETLLRDLLSKNELIKPLSSSSCWEAFNPLGPVTLVSSVRGGAGKTSSIFIMATLLAQRGVSVAVFDCDLRDGQFSSLIGARAPQIPTMANVASGKLTVKESMVDSGLGWDVLLAPHKTKLTENITDASIVNAISELRENYDVVLIDSSTGASNSLKKLLHENADQTLLLLRGSKGEIESTVRWFKDMRDEGAFPLERKVGIVTVEKNYSGVNLMILGATLSLPPIGFIDTLEGLDEKLEMLEETRDTHVFDSFIVEFNGLLNLICKKPPVKA